MSKQNRRKISAYAVARLLSTNTNSISGQTNARQRQQPNSLAVVAPTAEEDRAITAAALNDPDALPLTDNQLRQMRPARCKPEQTCRITDDDAE
jgi:hypothetical protein